MLRTMHERLFLKRKRDGIIDKMITCVKLSLFYYSSILGNKMFEHFDIERVKIKFRFSYFVRSLWIINKISNGLIYLICPPLISHLWSVLFIPWIYYYIYNSIYVSIFHMHTSSFSQLLAWLLKKKWNDKIRVLSKSSCTCNLLIRSIYIQIACYVYTSRYIAIIKTSCSRFFNISKR